MVFTPDSDLERHQKYFGAFSVAINNLTEYLSYITRFINDGSISHLNDDDIQFFKDLLFESKHGKVHIVYYDWIFHKWLTWAPEQSMFTISRYADFLIQVSELFLHDMFHYIFKNKQDFIEDLFNKLSPDNKVHFIKVGLQYPKIIKDNPKFKMYLLFS